MGRLTQAIIEAIQASDQSLSAIARETGVPKSQLSRLVNGETGLNAETVETLANYLQLEITIRPRRRTPRKGR